LQEVVRLKPDYAEAYYTLGTVDKQAGNLPAASEALRAAIRLQPDFAGAHITLAAVLRQQGDSAGAASENKLGAELTQNTVTLQAATFATNSGTRMMNAGDIEGAIAQFESAIKSNASYAPAHQQLATALERKGDKQRASKELAIFRELQTTTRVDKP